MKSGLTVAIIAGNAENSIKQCLQSALFADDIVVVAANSTDATVALIKKYAPGARIRFTTDSYNRHFTKWRNLAYRMVKTSWVFYLDTDEIITPALKQELLELSSGQPEFNYYVVPRENYFLNHRVRYGGTYPDYVKRLYFMPAFAGYRGVLHEEPVVTGQLGYLKNPLLHYTHRELSEMLNKSLAWTDMEARALKGSGHPSVVWWRILRMMLTKFWQRFVLQSMWRDGIVGWISVIFECFDTYMIYSRLYELQSVDA